MSKSDTINMMIAAIRAIANEDDEMTVCAAALKLYEIFNGDSDNGVTLPIKPVFRPVDSLPGDAYTAGRARKTT